MPPYVPNDAMRVEARRGLDWREKHGRGGTAVGVARARDIVNGKNLPIGTVKRMRSYFARHEVDKQGQGWSPGEDGYPSAGRIAWALWGGDPGRAWANSIVAEYNDDEDDEDDDDGRSAVPVTLCRTSNLWFPAESFEVRSAVDGDGFTLTGYAAVFNSPTRIDSWEGKFDEIIARGAFKKTIRERTPILQWNHGNDPAVGQVPIGAITGLREDARGLFVEARLHDNDAVKPIRDAIASGAVQGMSFRFQVVKESWDDFPEVPVRTISEIRLMELGPVAFPAYADTSVGVREDQSMSIVNPDSFDSTPVRAADEALVDGAAGSDALEPGDPTPFVNPGFVRFVAHVEALRSAK